MDENIKTTRYKILDVRENCHHTIILICQEWNGYRRRRITLIDNHKPVEVYDDALLLAPGDVILVHETDEKITEIEY